MTTGSLMKVKSIVECPFEHSATLLTCIKNQAIFGRKNQYFLVFLRVVVLHTLRSAAFHLGLHVGACSKNYPTGSKATMYSVACDTNTDVMNADTNRICLYQND